MSKTHKYKDKVIIGDGPHQKEVEIEFKKPEWAQRGTRPFVGDTEFDGHYVLWGFEYFPTTYLKSSGLSGDEYRKGGEIRYFRNRKQCYSEFCRDPLVAHNKIGATLLKLMDFNWDKYKVGEKVWYNKLPCVITMLCEDQGCAVLEREDKQPFPHAPWHNPEDWMGGGPDESDSVKVEVTSENVFWYRK